MLKLVVISPPGDEPRELETLAALVAAGLERYHVRKPGWSRAQLDAWLQATTPRVRARLVLHQHHDLVAEYGLLGRHWRDDGSAPASPQREDAAPVDPQRDDASAPASSPRTSPRREATCTLTAPARDTAFTSRSCHDFATVRAALGRYDSVFLGPVFPSISKPGHGATPSFSLAELAAWLARRSPAERSTEVIALGGITPARLARVAELGFDGAALLGALWDSPRPLEVWHEAQTALLHHAA